MKKYIGTNYFNYNQVRNFTQLIHKEYEFLIVKDFFRFLTNIAFRLTQKVYLPFQFFFLPLRRGNVALYHFFNAICLVNKPWIVTFETSLPRLGNAPKWLYTIAAKRLAHDSCKKIIAMSDCTAHIQREFIQKNYPDIADKILSKMIILHPAQSALVNSSVNKDLNSYIIFTLVGSDFFRKGGKEVLHVFDNLLMQGHAVHLNIVSTLDYGDYASQSTIKDYNNAIQIIEKHTSSITHYKHLANSQVLELLKSSHVGLLPTYADTYGYSVLEAQAAGCPVITTNVRALPEINNEACGWIIEVPKKYDGNAQIDTFGQRAVLSSTVENKLMEIILGIMSDKTVIEQKRKRALERIKLHHEPSAVAEILSAVYDEVVRSTTRN